MLTEQRVMEMSGLSCGVHTLTDAWSGTNNLYATEFWPAAKLVLHFATSCIFIVCM